MRRRMRKYNVGQTPRSRDAQRAPSQAEIADLLAGRTWFWSAGRKRKSPGRPVLVLPFLRIAGTTGTARARPYRARARRRSSLFGGFFELFGGPARRGGGRVLPFKKRTVRRRG